MSKTHYSAEQFLNELSANWVESGTFRPKDMTEDADKFVLDLEDWVRKNPSGSKLKSDLRQKLHAFAYGNSFKPDGASHVSVFGTYVVGTTVKNKQDYSKLAHRYKGEHAYASALLYGFEQAMKERKFVPSKDYNYTDILQAQLAIEEDSLSSKGPFDGGDEWVAVKAVDAMLDTTSHPMDYNASLLNLIVRGLNRRREEYQGHINPKFSMQPSNYVEMILKGGLRDTFRGLPFLAAGNSPLQKWQYDLSNFMFNHLSDYPFTDAVASNYVKKMTVDEFIQENLVWLHEVAKLKLSEWYHMRHSMIVIISRDQGAPFDIKYDGDNWKIFDRKDRKWRIVTPMPAFVQAWQQVAGADIIKAAPLTEGRIGLQDPATNNRRYADFIERSESNERVIIPADFSKFDTTIPSWVMNAVSAMYASLYEDAYVKDALAMVGVVMSQKNLLLPIRTSSRNTPYGKHHYKTAKWIKGDRNYMIDNSIKGLKYSNLRKKLKDTKNNFDYQAGIFYIHDTYLTSGHYFTNTMGSDSNHLISRDIQPHLTRAARILEGRSLEKWNTLLNN